VLELHALPVRHLLPRHPRHLRRRSHVSALGPVDCLRQNKRTHLTALILKAFSFGQSTGYHAVTWLQAEALRLGLESGARVLDLHPLPVRHHLPRHPRHLRPGFRVQGPGSKVQGVECRHLRGYASPPVLDHMPLYSPVSGREGLVNCCLYLSPHPPSPTNAIGCSSAGAAPPSRTPPAAPPSAIPFAEGLW